MNAMAVEPARIMFYGGQMTTTVIRCPFEYASGKKCDGHIVRVEAYKADLIWQYDASGWSFDHGRPRSHYHLFCSEKGNHAGFKRENALKFYFDQLPEALQNVLSPQSTGD
jgi:hypothetical protein